MRTKFILGVLFIVLLISCKEDKYINVNHESIVFNSSEDNVLLEISSNDSWTLSLSDTWIYSNVSQGSGNASVEIKAKPNDTFSKRSSNISVNTSYGECLNIPVLQNQNDAIIGPTSKSFTWEGGGWILEYQSNIPISYSTNNCDWIVVNEVTSKALDNRHLSIKVEKNMSSVKRNCQLQLKGNDLLKNITITQDAFIKIDNIQLAEGVTYDCYGFQEFKLTPIFYPENASCRSLVWSSSDESIAQVDQNGIVSTFRYGTVTITAKDEFSEVFTTILINILPKKAESMRPSNNLYEINGTFGFEFTPSFTPYPEDGYLGELVLTSSNPSIASVVDGKIVCNSNGIEGETQITVKSTYSSISSFLNVHVAYAYASTGIGWVNSMDYETQLTLAGILHSDNPNDKYIITGIYYTDENNIVHLIDVKEGLYLEGSNRVRWESASLSFNEHFNSLRDRSKKWTVYLTYTNNGVLRNATSSVNLGYQY